MAGQPCHLVFGYAREREYMLMCVVRIDDVCDVLYHRKKEDDCRREEEKREEYVGVAVLLLFLS